MPLMPRQNKKASKIVFNILGTPANLKKNKTVEKPLRKKKTNKID